MPFWPIFDVFKISPKIAFLLVKFNEKDDNAI